MNSTGPEPSTQHPRPCSQDYGNYSDSTSFRERLDRHQLVMLYPQPGLCAPTRACRAHVPKTVFCTATPLLCPRRSATNAVGVPFRAPHIL